MRTHRRAAAVVAAPALDAIRVAYGSASCDVERVAALVEIAATAAALARHLVRLRHLDPDLIAPHVSSRVDAGAVLGRGRWLPTMVELPAVADPATFRASVERCTAVTAAPRRPNRKPAAMAGQGSLFAPAGSVEA